jgi:hypothetical protein
VDERPLGRNEVVSPLRKLFVEGGGNHNGALKTECRRAFTALLERAGCKGRPQVIPCGGRQNAYEQFCTAIRGGEVSALLLVDAEAPVVERDPWRHVAQRPDDKWQKPAGATEDHLHLMVQCMEAWFLADRQALHAFKLLAMLDPNRVREAGEWAKRFFAALDRSEELPHSDHPSPGVNRRRPRHRRGTDVA